MISNNKQRCGIDKLLLNLLKLFRITSQWFHLYFISGIKTESGDKTSDAPIEKRKAVTEKSYELFSHKVSALRQKLEFKSQTKQEIFKKYTSNQRPKLKPKPKLSAMADTSDGDGTGSKFKNIRMMFESKCSMQKLNLSRCRRITFHRHVCALKFDKF